MNETGHPIQAEISQEEFASLGVIKNQQVFVTLKEIVFSEYEI